MTSFNRVIFEHRALLLALFVSLAIKALLLLQDPVVNRDAVLYIAAAESFSQGNFAQGVKHYRMPLYPLLLTAFHFFVPNWILAGQLLHALFLLFSLIPLYFLTLNLFNRSAAFFTALLFAVVPVFNGVGSITRDPPFLFLVLCALALLSAEGGKFSARRFLLVGVLVVVATFIRIEGIVLLGLLPVMLFWQYRTQLSIKKTGKIVAATAATVTILFFSVWLLNLMGFTTQSRLNELNIWIRHLRTFDTYFVLMDFLREIQSETPRGHMKYTLIAKVRHYAPLIYFLGLVEIIITKILPTSLVALWALRWRQEALMSPQRTIITWPWAAFFLVGFLFFMLRNFVVTRYVWVPIALTIPFVGYGMSLWWQKFKGKKVPLIFISLLFFAPATVKTMSEVTKDSRDSVREVGQWLRAKDPHHQLNVFYNDRRFPLYADRAGEHAKSVRGSVEDGRLLELFNDEVDLILFRYNSKRIETLDFTGVTILLEYDDGRSKSFVLSKNVE